MTGVNKLDHLLEFQAILEAYVPSEKNRQLLNGLELLLLLAPTATGRNTVIRELVKTGDYHYIVSDTTRKPRANDGVMEQNGVEYWFKPEDIFLTDLRAGNYLEAEVIHQQQVSGIHIHELEKAAREHKIAINEVDIAGIANTIAVKSDTKAVLLLPPSFNEWQHRIHKRGAPEPAELRRRMQTALAIFTLAAKQPEKFYFVVNESIEDTIDAIKRIAAGKVTKESLVEHAQAALEDCLSHTRHTLQ